MMLPTSDQIAAARHKARRQAAAWMSRQETVSLFAAAGPPMLTCPVVIGSNRLKPKAHVWRS